MTQANTTQTSNFMNPQEFLAHWLGHRRLTRRIIEQFPADKLFEFKAAAPMRPFGDMAWELVRLAEYNLHGLQTGEWPTPAEDAFSNFPRNKTELLTAWDELTAKLEQGFAAVPSARFAEMQNLFWGPMLGQAAAMYSMDNEIHHRGQGYVYLRALGIEPAAFWER